MNPTRTIKITRKNDEGKMEQIDVRLMYCLASEIGFQNESGKTMDVFNPDYEEKDGKLVLKAMPQATDKDYITLVLACITAAYESEGQEAPVKSDTLIYHATREEISALVAAVVSMRAEWLFVPATIKPEMADKKGKKRKNA
jgi:hypothetical protein